MKKLLHEETKIAHKTGTGSTNKENMTYAVNDVGIITLPNGKHLALSIFVNEAYSDFDVLETVVAQSAKVIYDCFEKMN